MTNFAILQCLNKQCNFRCPADLKSCSSYCPICGERMEIRVCAIDNGYAQFTKNTLSKLECALDNVRSCYNVGSAFRSSCAFSINHLYLCGFTPTPAQRKVLKTSLGSERYVPWSYERNALTLIQQKREQRYSIYSIESSSTAISITTPINDLTQKNILLIFGNENFGIDPEIRKISNAVLQIPTTGNKPSLNIASAFAIAVFYFSTFFTKSATISLTKRSFGPTESSK